jgi:glutamate synthase (NADPH/NADH) small chain
VYRRSEAEMTAYHFEYLFALGEGVSFMFLTQPVEVVGNGKVEGLKCVRMELGEPDHSGRRMPVAVKGSEFVIPCDMVVTAIGQKKHTAMLAKLAEFGVKTTKNGYIDVADDTLRTAHPKIFAGGDCIRSKGEASTVAAVQDGKIAAAAIHHQLVGEHSPNKKHIEPVLSPVT